MSARAIQDNMMMINPTTPPSLTSASRLMGSPAGVSASWAAVIAWGGVIKGYSSWARALPRHNIPDNMMRVTVMAVVFMAAPFRYVHAKLIVMYRGFVLLEAFHKLIETYLPA